MNQLKLAITTIYFLTSASAFAQLRGSTVPATPSTAVTPTTQYNAPSTNGTATYGSDTTTASTPVVTPAANAAVTSTGTTTGTSTDSSGFTPVVTDSSGIQSAGKSSSGNNNVGLILGIGATAFTGYEAVQNCPNNPSCVYWVAGVVASVAVTAYMATAKSKSDGTVSGVTDDPAASTTATSSSTPTTAASGLTPVAYSSDPSWQAAQQSIGQLAAAGWNVNPTTGTATNATTGQTISAADLASPAAMSAAGFSAADIKGIQSVLDQAQAAGKKLAATRGADAAGNIFDGTVGGGKSGSSVMNGALAGAALRTANRQAGMGINRDPAQVAGMAKSYNGEQIGVAQDSLFNMIDRRYQLHEKNGSFISP